MHSLPHKPKETVTAMARMIPLFLVLVFLLPGLALAEAPFVTVWKTDNDGAGDSNQIVFPGLGQYQLEWESIDDSSLSGSTAANGSHTITVEQPGTYRVTASGELTGFRFADWLGNHKLLDIEQWGDIRWENLEAAFSGAANLKISANDAPDLSRVTSLGGMFRGAQNMNAPIGHWDTSNVRDMSWMFSSARQFNQDIGDWDVSQVTDMQWMFSSAISFNQYIGEWDVGRVTDMSTMFTGAIVFNQDIGSWDVSQVTDMGSMFYDVFANLMLLEDGTPLTIWFMHAEDSRQVWLLGQGGQRGPSFKIPTLHNTAGRFGEGFDPDSIYPEPDQAFALTMDLDQLDDNAMAGGLLLQLDWPALDERALAAGQHDEHNESSAAVSNPYVRSRQPLHRLSTLAGTRCDNQHPQQGLSGLWCDPQPNGEGFVLEVAADGQALVYWYTYTPDGNDQAWMLGQGELQGDALHIEQMYQPRHTGNTVFGATDIDTEIMWGSIRLQFVEADTAELSYESELSEYGSGQQTLQQLARPMLAECPAN